MRFAIPPTPLCDWCLRGRVTELLVLLTGCIIGCLSGWAAGLFGELRGPFGMLWDPLGVFGARLRVTWGALVASWDSQGTLQGVLRLAFRPFGLHWGTAWSPLGCLTSGLGNSREVSKALGGSLGLLPERPRSTLIVFLRIKNDVPETIENRLSKPVKGPKAHFGRQLQRNHWL